MNYIKKGFTLVELLIVISLLGAIALIVIAAINPIEQANRARDARFKADSSQVLSATQRYYAAKSKYPWMDVTPLTYTGPEIAFGFLSAADNNVGICGGTNCSTDGVLVTNNEILNAFKSRDFITTTNEDNKIFIGKATGSGSTPYACFIPTSLSAKSDAASRNKVYQLGKGASVGTRTVDTSACTTSPTTANWGTGGGLSCYVCVPE